MQRLTKWLECYATQDGDIGDYGGVRVHVDVGAVESDGDIRFDGVTFERVPGDPEAAKSSPSDLQYVAYIVSQIRGFLDVTSI